MRMTLELSGWDATAVGRIVVHGGAGAADRLVIKATSASDVIVVAARTVTVNGIVTEYTGIESLVIWCGAGADHVTIVETTPARVVVDGGVGNDQIWGSLGNEMLLGGPGNDRLFGNDGDDVLLGGPGNDELSGGPGDDVLMGGPGNDQLDGGEGHDLLLGGWGNDALKGGSRFGSVYEGFGHGGSPTFNDWSFGGPAHWFDALDHVFANGLWRWL